MFIEILLTLFSNLLVVLNSLKSHFFNQNKFNSYLHKNSSVKVLYYYPTFSSILEFIILFCHNLFLLGLLSRFRGGAKIGFQSIYHNFLCLRVGIKFYCSLDLSVLLFLWVKGIVI